ncbi:XrtA-associated tyrosine autokinase [Geobacter argillaceus]|uniref:Receptor protein-tyrosine kinase/non-specific protein-tyrosine kinase n=1 Tax=Geobacter argillaceus TaxID=345631 RepID=A0A562VHD2_9BACT|nr:XrtA-associated tyrosine autokinase [Geobacter argillaceus]TWJ17325.1 receptor protein-tyrosine kinase/non-specific protein-tyrosine kinase [Geobacter argillaceus]
MSRIERALEKASQMRGSGGVAPSNSQQQRQGAPSNIIETLPPPNLQIKLSNPLLVAGSDPSSPAAEEYRKLKSILVKLTKSDEFHNTIMVTSSVAGEGKTITSLNLALSLAQQFDHTVLLIDADLRRPSVHRYLGITAERGLADCLSGDAELGDVLINTGIGKLVVLPAGKDLRNPVELFTSQKMSDLLMEIKYRYPDRYIVIDTPPILPFAETRHLSHLVDGTIFVVKEDGASLQGIKEALESLGGSNVLGIVYNEARIDRMDDRYYYYRSYASSNKH